MENKALAIIPKTLEEATELAERLSKSSLLPKDMIGKMPDVLVTILAGQEMGFAPMASLRAFHVIGGKPVLGADGMVALVLGSGKAEYFERVAESDTEVTYETKRVGAKLPRRCTWTIAMAKAAALHQKDNWRTFPRAMLASRAKSELARDVYPDVLAGCYTEDELPTTDRPSTFDLPPHIRPITKEDIQDAEVVAESTDDLAKLCAEAGSVAELEALAPRCAQLPNGPKRSLAREAYGARMKFFEAQLKQEPAA